LFWSNANLYGGIDIDMDRRLDLGLAAQDPHRDLRMQAERRCPMGPGRRRSVVVWVR
jgi:hypothetical protein